MIKCDMTSSCLSAVNHISARGFLYCDRHVVPAMMYGRCRKLLHSEVIALIDGGTIAFKNPPTTEKP